MQQIAGSKGGKCLSDHYENAHEKLLWECSIGHQWLATAHGVKNHGNWCRFVMKQTKNEDMAKIAEKERTLPLKKICKYKNKTRMEVR